MTTMKRPFLSAIYIFSLAATLIVESEGGLSNDRLQMIQVSNVEFRNTGMRDVVAYLEVISNTSGITNNIHFRLEYSSTAPLNLQDQHNPTLCSLIFSTGTFQELLDLIATRTGVRFRYLDHTVLVLSSNPGDFSETRPGLLQVKDISEITPSAEAKVKLRYANTSTDNEAVIFGSYPLVIDTILNPIASSESSLVPTQRIARVEFDSKKSSFSVRKINPRQINQSESLPVSWRIVEFPANGSAIRVSAYPTFVWSSPLSNGTYRIDIQAPLRVLKNDASVFDLEASKTFTVQVTNGPTALNNQDCFMAWFWSLYDAYTKTQDHVFRNQLLELISLPKEFVYDQKNQGDVGVIAYELGQYDLAYNILNDYLGNYLSHPPVSTIEDIHDSFYRAQTVFSRLCEDQQRQNPYKGITLK